MNKTCAISNWISFLLDIKHKEVAQRENHRSTIERRAQLEFYPGAKTRVCRWLFNDKPGVPVGIYRRCLRSNDPPTPIIFQPQLFPTKTEAVTLALPAFGNF
jgi:hypothetical protein